MDLLVLLAYWAITHHLPSLALALAYVAGGVVAVVGIELKKVVR